MTEKEHQLILAMFTRQNMLIQMLIDMLKRDGTIEGDDVDAFDFAVRNDPASVSAFLRASEQYRSFAQAIGLELPPLNKKT